MDIAIPLFEASPHLTPSALRGALAPARRPGPLRRGDCGPYRTTNRQLT